MPALPLVGALALASSLLAKSAAAATLLLSTASFGGAGVAPSFGAVSNFEFQVELAGPLRAGAIVDNASVALVQYLVSGGLSTNPPTPSGFPAFFLNRRPGGEGPITATEWIAQGSSLSFEIAPSADLVDGLQLSELVPDAQGLLFELDAREFERLDRARYHPPQVLLFADGTGILRNSNNSSGSTGTTNPGTGMSVDVDFGEEYVTQLGFEPSAITLVVPEPGTGLLLAGGLVGLGLRRRRRGSAPPLAPCQSQA